jgi:hypothetical protein
MVGCLNNGFQEIGIASFSTRQLDTLKRDIPHPDGFMITSVIITNSIHDL